MASSGVCRELKQGGRTCDYRELTEIMSVAAVPPFARPTAAPAQTGMAAAAAVLIVDDEVRSVEALARTLEEDFTVYTATSAEEALEILRRELVTIVLCD